MTGMSEIAHQYVLPALHKQALCIDGTLGYGRDSLFFLKNHARFVHAWEIQDDLIEQVKTDFATYGTRFILHPCGHEQIGAWHQKEKQSVDAAIFNFGYNPRTLSGICTKADTSLQAVLAVFDALRPKGRMALVFYPHEEGRKEYDQIYAALSEREDADLLEIRVPDKPDSPFVLGVARRR